ncbi:MAG: outer membrane lipoprotein-sorting protein [Candidatus Cloacimonadota bacterium]|nr:MAG: outer membrane lipoprotein-sorting protein [Candidatus Cloacimonadota bacterium]PIE78766.1 MAG: outer membrane lipoprotein-sorting protein [Candidatus Delongbacteria bacterium]
MKNLLLLTLILLISFSQTFAESLSAREVMEKVDNRDEGETMQSKVEMILINKRGKKRVRSIESYSKNYGKDSKSVMFFQKPADVKGTAFLAWEYDDISKDDAKWLYLPALRKVRRISGSSEDDYFMGSDFTYDDMGDRNIDEDTYQFVSESKIVNNKECWIIKSTPVEQKVLGTYKIISVRKDNLVVIKADYYKKDQLVKTLDVEEIEKIDNIWVAKKMVMDNFEKKHKTIINISDIKINQKIKEKMFKVSTIERGKF